MPYLNELIKEVFPEDYQGMETFQNLPEPSRTFPEDAGQGIYLDDLIKQREIETEGFTEFKPDQERVEKPFFERIKDRWNTGEAQRDLGLLYYRKLTGDESPELESSITAITAGMPKDDKTPRNIFERAVGGTAEMLPIMVEGIKRGTERGLVLGMGAAGITAIAGQVPPFTALPEEAITVPAAFAGMYGVGAVSGAVENIGQIEAGLAYKELLEIKDEDGKHINPLIAKSAAAGVGIINGLVELAQIKMLLKTIPGGDALIRGAIRESIKKAVMGKGLKAVAIKNAAKYGAFVAGETAQEVVQESTNIIASELAKSLTNKLDKTNLKPAEKKEIVNRLLKTAEESALSFAVMGFPGPAITTGKAAISRRGQAEAPGVPPPSPGAARQPALPPPPSVDELRAKVQKGEYAQEDLDAIRQIWPEDTDLTAAIDEILGAKPAAKPVHTMPDGTVMPAPEHEGGRPTPTVLPKTTTPERPAPPVTPAPVALPEAEEKPWLMNKEEFDDYMQRTQPKNIGFKEMIRGGIVKKAQGEGLVIPDSVLAEVFPDVKLKATRTEIDAAAALKGKSDPLGLFLEGDEKAAFNKKLADDYSKSLEPKRQQIAAIDAEISLRENEIAVLSAEMETWKAKVYKGNESKITTGDTGGFDNLGTRKTIGDINEAKRQRRIANIKDGIDSRAGIISDLHNKKAEVLKDHPELSTQAGAGTLKDSTGNPLVLYHGTDKPEFDVFKPGWREPAIFLTPVEENAWKYAKGVGTPSPTARVEKMTVDIRNPLIVEGRTGTNGLYPLTEAKMNELRGQGYDGIVSLGPSGKIEHAREIIPFSPEQIKRIPPSPLPTATSGGKQPWEGTVYRVETGGTPGEFATDIGDFGQGVYHAL
ncbi:MAG: hypothetical protein U1C57_02005, partial [Candidatus Doudnabacteria bacterium]|nr:hypothetical protein [Candidatus Doudnabacteria bacterium]